MCSFMYRRVGRKKFPSKETVKVNGKAMYTPHVLGVMVNQPVKLLTATTLFIMYALFRNSPQFNVAQPKRGMKMTKLLLHQSNGKSKM